ncbi:MAG: ribonuclease P protein component [Chitinophagaceae bacterium]|nr:ribonuclease P protein component [Chitinophagaceae bacterium]MBK7678364.1 ribonuclease P protein component [Chitinophagaceae bacterium]MBK8300277.1 ribonuclease P protein component [Chitinophagaceae bacterium]MBK9464321.1 ribonuclease P protein component [Chitinophagaceae bacterium]MBK9658555.1 ribonuclease P protein component [Chitinophagaceae bacterium]
MAKLFTLKKTERLKSRKQTEQLFREGKRFTLTPFRIYYLFNNDKNIVLQFGAGVSSKIFKKAVDRNRVKRLIREAYRLQKISLQEKLAEKNIQLNLFFIYTGNELPVYKEVFDKTGKVLEKLLLIAGEQK